MDILLEQSVLGPDGAVKRLITALPRGFTLVAVAQSGTRNLYLLRQVRGDSAMLLLTDSVGQTLRQPRQYLPMIGGEAKKLVAPRLYGLPGGKGFVLTYPSGKSARPALQVRGFSPALSGLWQQQFDPTCITAVEQIAANDTHVWLVLKEYLALALRPRVLSFRLETGEMTCNQSLAPNDVLDAATVMPAGLLVLGTSDRRSSYVAPVNQRNATGSRRDFALLLSPTGQRSFGVGLVWPPPGRPAHYRWQSACLLPDGGYQLIGETFRNAANAGVIALGVLGAGMLGTGGFGILPLGGYTNERPLGLVVAQLSATGQLAAVHELDVPEVVQAADAKAASNAFPQSFPASFRFRGFSSDHRRAVLNTSHQVVTYSFIDHQLRPLAPSRLAVPTVLYIDADRLAISWAAKPGDPLPDFELVALP